MKLIDTHTHLYLPQFDEDRQEVIQRAIKNGIGQFFLPNIDSSTVEVMLQMEKDYPGTCYPMLGLHPCSVKENWKEELSNLQGLLDQHEYFAVGEIGIDLYWDKTFFEQQKAAFNIQIDWAKDRGLPIVIHSRESTDIVIDLLQKVKDERLWGIFHCFGGTVEQAKKIIDLGFYLGIGGVLTFKKSGLDKTMEEVALEHIVLETDSPYLAPTPFRGKRNESGYVLNIAEKLARVKNKTLEEVAQITTYNAQQVFKSAYKPEQTKD